MISAQNTTEQLDLRPVLITGATGGQGGSVAAHALKKGMRVRALVRDQNSQAACALADSGIELAPGDFSDASTLAAGSCPNRWCSSVFTVPSGQAGNGSACRSGQADERIIAHCGDGLKGQISGSLNGPLIVLFEQ
jgi:hypothetical protein